MSGDGEPSNGCPRTDRAVLTDGGEPVDGVGDDGETVADASGDDPDSPAADDAVAKHSVSRRGMLLYGGGSALVTLGGAGAGWFAFIRASRGPEEEVVREYVDAIDRGYFYTAQELFHENAPTDAWGQDELPGVDRISLSVERTAVADREEDPGLEGVEELALVHVDITMEGGVNSELLELAFVVAQNEAGEWKLWRDR
jgi:hypothetical protein